MRSLRLMISFVVLTEPFRCVCDVTGFLQPLHERVIDQIRRLELSETRIHSIQGIDHVLDSREWYVWNFGLRMDFERRIVHDLNALRR